ncbi:MAG: transposase [Proteobacteria bacterium]|nr:transposase [Pseudomonadota bacterium]
MNAITYGLDIAKRVFQLYWVEHESGEIHIVKYGKQELLEFFAQREAGLIAMEACGSAHWWRRKLKKITTNNLIGLCLLQTCFFKG